MNNFEYAVPANVDQIFSYLGDTNAKLKAGGIDLLDLMKEELISPGRLVHIRDLEILRFLKKEKNGDLLIGPALTLHELAVHSELKGKFQALAQAAGSAAAPQIRNVATLGGNLCQRPRCWYFRSKEFNCSRKGGDRCFALDGENQYHAIFDNSDGCAIVHPSSTAVALMAFDARIRINDGRSEKEVGIADFFVKPAENIEKENILGPKELISAVIIPAQNNGFISYYYKHKEKLTFDWPLADVAVALKMQGNTCQEARIILGSAAPVPWRAGQAELILQNQKVSKAIAQKAADIALADAEPLEMNKYKIPVFKSIVYRTICYAAGLDPMS
jgi:xanthine dehydrogenase YagS FAD-binding subunit